MEKERRETVSKEVKHHEFYCDGCSKKLGESEEYDDGYYEHYGVYEQRFYIKVFAHLSIRKNYCKACAEKKDKDIAKRLLELDFMFE